MSYDNLSSVSQNVWNFISSLPVKRGGSLSFLVKTISNVLVMEIGWTDVGSGGYILVSCAHSNTSISVILLWPVLLVEETGVPGENQRLAASHWQTLSHNVVLSTPCHERGFELTTLVVIGTDCIGRCKCNYHSITSATAPHRVVKKSLKLPKE